jgi:hypothetical protein
MFDLLKNEKIQNVAPAIHHSIQLLRQQWISVTDIDDRLATKSDDSLTPKQALLVAGIVSEIESKEKIKINDLRPEKEEQYILLLTSILQQLSTDQFNANKDKGKKLLEQMRSTDTL